MSDPQPGPSGDFVAEALARGLVSEAQARDLAALARELAPRSASPSTDAPTAAPRTAASRTLPYAVAPDEERLRFVSGFGDVFVTLGLGLFLVPLALLAPAPFGNLLAAAASLGLAEYFTRRRRMALPSIALLVAFALACLALFADLFGARSASSFGVVPLRAAGAAALTTAAVGLHYLRYRVPITVAASVAALLATLVALSAAASPGLLPRYAAPVALASGLVAFAVAMRFDLADPSRLSRAADVAFWLHLLAAPLIVHATLGGLLRGGGGLDTGRAVLVLVAFLGLGAVAVLVDRRALLVSGLAYAGYALAQLVFGSAPAAALPVALTLGAFVLALSAGWGPLRARVLGALPAALSARLPRPAAF